MPLTFFDFLQEFGNIAKRILPYTIPLVMVKNSEKKKKIFYEFLIKVNNSGLQQSPNFQDLIYNITIFTSSNLFSVCF